MHVASCFLSIPGGTTFVLFTRGGVLLGGGLGDIAGSPSKAAPAVQGGGGKGAAVRSEEKWYAGEIDRTRCEGIVKACMQGDYLVRKSSSSSGYVLCVNDMGQSINYTIACKDPTTFLFTQAIFRSLEDAVTYAKGTPLKSVARPGSRLILNHPAINESYLCVDRDRPTSERMVAAANHGDFTVRLSSSGDKYVLVVNVRILFSPYFSPSLFPCPPGSAYMVRVPHTDRICAGARGAPFTFRFIPFH